MTVLLVDDIILYPIPEGVEVLDSSLAPKAKRKMASGFGSNVWRPRAAGPACFRGTAAASIEPNL